MCAGAGVAHSLIVTIVGKPLILSASLCPPVSSVTIRPCTNQLQRVLEDSSDGLARSQGDVLCAEARAWPVLHSRPPYGAPVVSLLYIWQVVQLHSSVVHTLECVPSVT